MKKIFFFKRFFINFTVKLMKNLQKKDSNRDRTLLHLSRTAKVNDSMKQAKHVLGELGYINTLHRGKVERSGFAVLKSSDIQSILIETAFISNPSEELRLINSAYQEKLASAILGGIKSYFSKKAVLSIRKIAQSS